MGLSVPLVSITSIHLTIIFHWLKKAYSHGPLMPCMCSASSYFGSRLFYSNPLPHFSRQCLAMSISGYITTVLSNQICAGFTDERLSINRVLTALCGHWSTVSMLQCTFPKADIKNSTMKPPLNFRYADLFAVGIVTVANPTSAFPTGA